MAQRHHDREAELAGEIDDAWIESLRRDPDVFVYRRTTDKPFVPTLRVIEPGDVLWLMSRVCMDEKSREARSVRRETS